MSDDKSIREVFRDKVNKIENIKSFIKIHDIDKNIYHVIDQVFEMFSYLGSVSPEFKQVLQVAREELDKEMPKLIESLVPIFDNYFGDQELEDVLAFYDSSAGKKVLGFRAELTKECEKMGQEWMQPALTRVQQWINDNLPDDVDDQFTEF
jgi:hypothetical protein